MSLLCPYAVGLEPLKTGLNNERLSLERLTPAARVSASLREEAPASASSVPSNTVII
jgi:hypothetical protein